MDDREDQETGYEHSTQHCHSATPPCSHWSLFVTLEALMSTLTGPELLCLWLSLGNNFHTPRRHYPELHSTPLVSMATLTSLAALLSRLTLPDSALSRSAAAGPQTLSLSWNEKTYLYETNHICMSSHTIMKVQTSKSWQKNLTPEVLSRKMFRLWLCYLRCSLSGLT